jgi:hypothetical protein
MNSRSLLPFLGLNKSENKFLNLRTVSGPIQPEVTAHGARRPATHSGQTAAWASGWQPSPEPVRPGRPDCTARTRRVHNAVTTHRPCTVARLPVACHCLPHGAVLQGRMRGVRGARRRWRHGWGHTGDVC